MATSNADLKTRIASLRHEILSYKPGKAVPCDDDRVVFPEKLVIGIVESRYSRNIVSTLRRVLHGDVEASKLADDKQRTSTENHEQYPQQYLSESVSVIIHRHGSDRIQELMSALRAGVPDVRQLQDVQHLARRVGCMVMLVDPLRIKRSLQWITAIKEVTEMTTSEDKSSGEFYLSERSNALQADAEAPNDEFGDILKQIADDLSEEAKIDSLGSQLGIIQGDIARALKTNMRYEQITSRGTHLMLIQWREGVSREDERIELRRALVGAKLLDLADHYFPRGTGPEPGPELLQKMEGSHQLPGIDSTPSAQGSSGGQTKTQETSAATGQSRVHDQSSKNQGDEPSECKDQLSEELTNQSTAGVHDTSKDMPYDEKLSNGGLPRLEHPQKIGEAPWSSGGQNKTNNPTTTTHQALDGTSPTNQREEASEGMDQYSEESSINNIANDVRETSIDVSSNEPFAEGTSTSDERSLEDITINYSDFLSNFALTETSSEKLLMICLMKVIIDIPLKAFGG